MDDQPIFGNLLKRYRRNAHLTQEDLAERAGYSSHYISMLERGVRFSPPLTVDLLGDALALNGTDRATLHAAVESHLPFATHVNRVSSPPIPLIGRGQDLARIVRLFGEREMRMLTLTGPGGVGKTALAQHVSAALAPSYSDGSAFVDLAAVSEPDNVIPAIARALALREGGGTIRDRLIAHLQERQMLLILDSFERVVQAAEDVGDLISSCPHINVLVTSRAPLRLRAEHEYRVSPLALPESDEIQSATGLLQIPAVALFVQRAKMVRRDLEITEGHAPVIADICRQLDGLPLAIELAAARLTHLPLVTLRDRLQHRLQILTGGTRDLPTRQQRMRDTIAWSYDLLTRSNQGLLRQLSVFAGGWTLEAAEQVCLPGTSADDALDGVRSLVESSLVVLTDSAVDEPHYRMLDTIQEFAAEQLATSDELDVARQRHSLYYVCLAEQAELALQDRDQRVWYPRLEREHDNLRVALGWLLQVREVELALRLAGAVWRFWQRHGDIREGRHWLEEGLARGKHVPEHVRAKALWGASWLAYHEGDYSRTRSLSTEHLALARKQGDALSTRNALTGLGMATLAEGRYAEAVLPLQEALDACMPLGKIWHRATSFLNLGNATMLAGNLTRATALFEEALVLYQERGDEVFTARARQHLGHVALLQGDYIRASTLFQQSIQEFFDLGEKAGIADGLEAAAAVHAATGGARQAGQLIAAATVLRESNGLALLPYLRDVWRPFVQRAESLLCDADWTEAQEDGRAMSLAEAVASAVGSAG